MPLLLENVSFSYPGKPVLQNFSLSAGDGERICLSGPSGCGKTTVLRLISGLLVPDSGRVFTGHARISYVFQEDRLVPFLTARENVSLVGDPEVLGEVGLGDAADLYPAEMSGGMKRRLAIARAMAYGGDLLLLDEPFNGIDNENRDRVAAAILKRFYEKTILLVTHITDDATLLNAKPFMMKTE